MTFDWAEYLTLAHQLAGPCAGEQCREACLRSSISRAYYSVFCMARDHLIQKESMHFSTKADVHMEVKEAFDIRDQLVATNLDRLRLDRNKADYDANISNLEVLCQKSLSRAQKAASRLKTRRR